MEKRRGPPTTSLRARKTHGDTSFPSLFWAKRASLMCSQNGQRATPFRNLSLEQKPALYLLWKLPQCN